MYDLENHSFIHLSCITTTTKGYIFKNGGIFEIYARSVGKYLLNCAFLPQCLTWVLHIPH